MRHHQVLEHLYGHERRVAGDDEDASFESLECRLGCGDRVSGPERALLDGERRRLSAFLGIPVDEARWPRLVQAARFDAMKERADDNAPGSHLGEWRSASDFFREGRMHAWRGKLGAESLALYDRLMAERTVRFKFPSPEKLQPNWA